jgi:hypothetical protein
VELKSFGVVSVEHDEGCGSEGDAMAKGALRSAAHVDCSNFILNGIEKDESRIRASKLKGEGGLFKPFDNTL